MSVYTEDTSVAIGAKGSDIYTASGVGDPRVALSTQLVRGATSETIRTGFQKIIQGPNDMLVDAVVMAFQARDIRGGKGERKVFFDMLKILASEKPELATAVLDLVPEYGSWKDMFTLAESEASLREDALRQAAKQIVTDEATLAAGNPSKLSLVAKWAPREGKAHSTLAKSLANKLVVPGKDAKVSSTYAEYRRRLSKLNAAIKTVETFECSNNWEEIEPARVPARAREIKKAAYLNEKVRKPGRRGTPELRHPDNVVRMMCRDHFQEFFAKAAKGEVKISGAETLYPHEIVTRAEQLIRDNPTEDDKNSLNAVWKAMVAKAATGGGLGKSLFMCDFSGSMSGTPMQVAKAMGLLGSAVCAAPFKGKFLTFNTTPEWCCPDTSATLFDQLGQLNFNWGGSTDIQKAGEMIIAELKAARAPPGAAPENIIIVTDMGFDAACSSSEYSVYTGHSYRHNVKTAPRQTHAQMLRENFRRASEDVHGDPDAWAAPRIVVWNVAATYSGDHQATATEEGVVTLSGWSPSLFKILCEEGPRVVTAYEALRVQLDDKRYDPVRQRVREWLDGGWRTMV